MIGRIPAPLAALLAVTIACAGCGGADGEISTNVAATGPETVAAHGEKEQTTPSTPSGSESPQREGRKIDKRKQARGPKPSEPDRNRAGGASDEVREGRGLGACPPGLTRRACAELAEVVRNAGGTALEPEEIPCPEQLSSRQCRELADEMVRSGDRDDRDASDSWGCPEALSRQECLDLAESLGR